MVYNISSMRNVFFILSTTFLIASNALAADGRNTFTGHYKNQIALHVGQGINSGFIIPPPDQFVPFNLLNIQYSQPTTFFGLPARQSINVNQTIGYGDKYGWHWRDYTIPMVMLSGDVRLSEYKNVYVASGAGIGLQAQQNERLGAKLLFQFKIIAGWHINDKWGLEVFMHHFSNANTADENYSYAFYGLGVTYNF